MTPHATAIVASGAEIADGAFVGPYCVVGPRVRLGEGVRLHSHVVVDGETSIGAGTEIFPFASIGLPPQDRKYRGEESRLVIGRNCRIREHVTIHPGTAGGGLVTEIGGGCLIFAGAHVAHDCRIGDEVVLVNNVLLGGHVRIADRAVLGGGAAVHQRVRIGAHAFVGGLSGVERDVIPFGSVLGNRAHLAGLNLVGLKRRGFPRNAIHALRRAFRLLFSGEGTLRDRVRAVEEAFEGDDNVRAIVTFIRAGGGRGLCMPRAGHMG